MNTRLSSLITNYGIFVPLAALSAVLPSLRGSRFLDRHQPDEVSGRFLGPNAVEDRQRICRHARFGSRRHRQSGRKAHGWPLLVTKAFARAERRVARGD